MLDVCLLLCAHLGRTVDTLPPPAIGLITAHHSRDFLMLHFLQVSIPNKLRILGGSEWVP